MKPLRLLLLICLLSTGAKAQYVANNKRIADVYFQNKDYYAAAEYYKKALNISTDTTGFVVPYAFEAKVKKESPKRPEYEYCVFQLASSLRLYKDFRGAEAWYAIARNFSDPKYVLSIFYFGESQRSNQKFNDAIISFKEFLTKYKPNDNYTEKAKLEIASCNFALYEMRYPRLYKFSKLLNQINDQGSNYTPLLMNNNFYFTSSRPVAVGNKTQTVKDSKLKTKVVKSENPFINAIYSASGSPLRTSTTVQKIGAPEKGKEFAAPAFSPNGRVMYMTSWSGAGNRKIYQVNVSRGTGEVWAAPKVLGTEVNVEGFNSMQPFVTKDGKYLIFSSDRPGGLGKYDLWYCKLRSDGTLSEASNMGNTINSKENEEAPYYNTRTKKLLFSSNGRVGMGGLDFYESSGDFGTWSEPRNLGFPFNSSKDDAYFTPADSEDSEGYISSDRESVCCLEIFHVKKDFLNVEGTVLDCKTNLPLDSAVVTLSDSIQIMKVITGADGKYRFKVNSNRQLILKAEKSLYFRKVLNYSYDELAKLDTLLNPRICLDGFIINKPVILENILYDFNSTKLNPASEAILDKLYQKLVDNETLEIELSAHTDNVGKAAYNVKLSERRAQSCVDYLVGKGIAASRITSKGYGFSKPIAPNQLPSGKDNPQGRQLNRRTEFKVTKQ